MPLPDRQSGRFSSYWSRWRRDSGQSLVITAIAMLVLLGMAGLAIDTSEILLARHRVQVAADAGALAAAQDLTGGAAATGTTQDTTAANDGTTVATANATSANVQVTAPYGADATAAKAVVSKSVPLIFGLSATVSATSVAENNLLQNGSFNGNVTNNFIEYCAADGVTTEGPYAFSCPIQNSSLNSWTVYSGGVDLNTSSYITPPASDPTAQSLDLVGSCNYDAATYSCLGTNCPSAAVNGGSKNVDQTTNGECQTNGEIYEKLNTQINGQYTINFDLSANSHGAPTNKLVSVYYSPYDPTIYGLGNGSGTGVGNATLLTPNNPGAGQTGPLVGTANAWTQEPSASTNDPLTFTASTSTTYLWFVSNEGCIANNAGGTVTAPNLWTAVAPNCRYGAAITDISVSGPNAENLSQ